MPLNKTIAYTLRTKVQVTNFTVADTTGTLKKIFDNSTEGCRVISIHVTNTAASLRNFTLKVDQGGVKGTLCAQAIPGGSGTNYSVAPASVMNRTWMPYLCIDSDGNPFFDFMGGETLYMSIDTALTGTETISVIVMYAKFDSE